MTQKKKLIRISEVIDRTGYGRTWIYNLIKKNSFPTPVKTGERTIAFVESEVDAWIDENIFLHVIRPLKIYYHPFIFNLKRLYILKYKTSQNRMQSVLGLYMKSLHNEK